MGAEAGARGRGQAQGQGWGPGQARGQGQERGRGRVLGWDQEAAEGWVAAVAAAAWHRCTCLFAAHTERGEAQLRSGDR